MLTVSLYPQLNANRRKSASFHYFPGFSIIGVTEGKDSVLLSYG
jgi:hypothetical protein